MMDRFLDRRNGAIDILRGLTMFLMVWPGGYRVPHVPVLSRNVHPVCH